MKNDLKEKLNKGLTLVELLVAIAILSIVLLWVGHFMVTSSGLFKDENSKASVQNEVQFATTMISDFVKGSQLGVSYTVDSSYVLSDSGKDGSEKVLYIFNLNPQTSYINVKLIKWVKSEKKLYLADVYDVKNKTKVDEDNATVSQTVIEAVGGEYINWELLSEHIDGFFVDMSAFDGTNTISVKVSSKRINKTYQASQTTKTRNNIILNASNISELYNLSDQVVATVIKAISVTAQNSTTVPGGQLLLSTKVSGEGFPAQSIYKWKVVKVVGNKETEVVYDSTSSDTFETYVDSTTNILNVSETMDSVILRVYAYASTRATDEDYVERTVNDISKIEKDYFAGGEIKTILIYDFCDIAVRDISSFTIKPNPDLTLGANSTLKTLKNEFSAITVTSPSEVINPGSMDAYPGNIIEMHASVVGSYLSDNDKSVYWTLEALNSDVIATISNTGILMIDKYSGGGRCIISCHSVLDTRLCLSYYVNIGNAFVEGNNLLELRCPENLNRGSTTQLELFMNGKEVPIVEFSNFIWTLELKDSAGRAITNNAASLDSKGILSISASLSYAYSFNLNIKVSLKSNSTIYVNKPVKIPKISISVNNRSYISKNTARIESGEIRAIVVGLDEGLYNLSWSIASENAPDYYMSSYANGTHVTADEGNSCVVVLNESPSVTYVRLKVCITGHNNYNAICKIILRDVSYDVTMDKQSIIRSDNSSIVKFTAQSPQFAGFNPNDIDWTIGEVKCNGKLISDHSGLVLEHTPTGARMYATKTFHISTSNVTVEVIANWAGILKSKVVTISPIEFTIEGPFELSKGGTGEYTISHRNVTVTDVQWSFKYSKANRQGIVIMPSETDIYSCNVSLTKNFIYPLGGATITLIANVPGYDVMTEKTITLQPFGSGFDLEDDPFINNY